MVGENNTSQAEPRPLFVLNPVVSLSGRFPLARPAGHIVTVEPSGHGVRPWNLRRMGPVMRPTGRTASELRYDPARQISTGLDGVPLTAGPPTASTTAKTDGEDPPSAEDWNNDFHPDAMP